MKHNITFEVTNNNGRFSISMNTEDLKKILDMLPSNLVKDTEKLFISSSLEDVLKNYLMDIGNWNIRERTRYATVTSNAFYNKSALYYHTGREGQLYLSSHKSISDNVLQQITYFSREPDFSNVLLKCYIPTYQYEAASEAIKSFFKKNSDEHEKILNFIQKDEDLKKIFQVEINSEERDFYLPPISKFIFYQEYSSRMKQADSQLVFFQDEETSKRNFKIFQDLLKNYTVNNNPNLLESDSLDIFIDYELLINYLRERKILLAVDRDTRFPSTNRIIFDTKDDLTSFLDEIEDNLELFFKTNGTMEFEYL